MIKCVINEYHIMHLHLTFFIFSLHLFTFSPALYHVKIKHVSQITQAGLMIPALSSVCKKMKD